MSGETLLGLVVGMVAGAFLVDTFQPAQDLYDNCKHEVQHKMHAVKGQVKTAAHTVAQKTGLKTQEDL